MSARKPFNLLRSFSILSLLCIGLMSSVSALLLSRLFTKDMLERDAVVTLQFVQSTVAAMQPDIYFEDREPSREHGTYAEFFARENHTQVKAAFEDFFKRIAFMPEVVRANVYGHDGMVIWSSHAELIGQHFVDNPELQRVLTGKLAIKTGKVTQPQKAEHVFVRENFRYFVESYIPIWDSQHARVIGVVEVYKVPDALFHAIARGEQLVWGSAVLGGLFLYGALFWIVRRATLVIRRQHAQLIETETLAAIGEMASAVAHNIRNPLASMRSSAEMALDEEEVPQLHQQARDIMAEVDRLESWLRELLTCARPLPSSPQPLQLADIMAHAIQAFDKRLARDKVRCILDMPAHLPQLQADGSLLQQAMHSVIANALDAMPHGGTLTLRGRVLEAPRCVQLQVTDTGRGIAPEHLCKVFRPFFTTKNNGLGVGLALVKRIVERHGGTVSLTSRVDHGTTVTLCFPVVE